jgi:hypothetical protein
MLLAYRVIYEIHTYNNIHTLFSNAGQINGNFTAEVDLPKWLG